MENVIKLDNPQKVNVIEWGFKHPNCDALILRNNDDYKVMYIVAYSVNNDGNLEIHKMAEDCEEYGVFAGIDKSMLRFIGGAYL